MPPETDNLQLEDLYREDQKDREKAFISAKEVEQLKKRDEARRQKVHSMIDLSEIRTKNDLYHAAVILYHGEDGADFLAAHRLASLSAVMGRKEARWLWAASLDRYFMKVGLPQVYGTQYEFSALSKQYELRLPVGEYKMLDFEKEFLGVPSIADRLKELNKQVKA